jgi:hypothetical protein
MKFDVTSRSLVTLHEMLIVAVNDSITSLPYNCNQAKVKEDQVKILGDTAGCNPVCLTRLSLVWRPGHIC